MNIAALAIAAGLLASAGRTGSTPEAKPRPGLPDWIDRVQTYGMVPVLPETAAKLHVSVNGVWAGVGGMDPILTHREIVPAVQARFGSDASAFVAACRRAGLVVCGMVYGMEGMPAMRAVMPDLDAMACRDAQGNPARAGSEMTLMCVNNPAWVRWETVQGKRAIDLGAEAVLLDTPMSASFISGLLRGGFCQHCLANFRRHLHAKFTRHELQERFDLTNFDARAVILRLSPQQGFPTAGRNAPTIPGADRRLFREFISCQEQASFDTRKKLIDTLRAYANAKRRKVAFCANASDLGTANPGGHWVRALMFADLFDLFAYELNHEPDGGMSSEVTRYPRGKWAAYHRLAYAIHHRRAPAVIHAGGMGSLLQEVLTQGKTVNTWMAVQSAEAYAAGGAYVQYHVEPPSIKDILLQRCWSGTARHADYVLSHRDLFDGEQRSGSPLAILFLLNERGRTIPAVCPSYLGFAQGLIEANYPFDVLFAGDGHYVRDRLTSADLDRYRFMLVPSPVEPTANQRRVLRGFVRAGGTLLCQEPQRLGLLADGRPRRGEIPSGVERQFGYGRGRVMVLRGKVTATGTGDIGAEFFRAYGSEARTAIRRLAGSLGLSPVVSDQAEGLVSAYPVLQPARRRVVVHLVNYDIDYAKDAIRQKVNLTIVVPHPAFLPRQVVARAYMPGEQSQKLPVFSSGDRLSFSLPRLGVCADIVISAR